MKSAIVSTMRGKWAGSFAVGMICLFGAGCGSGGGKAPAPSPTASAVAALTGRATLTIKWPTVTETRLIPDRSNSILLNLVRSGANGEETVATQLVPRPADVSVPTQVIFDRLPVGTLALRASAYPNANGTGVAQSSGTVSVEISNAAVTDFGTLTLNSTIASVTLEPPAGNSVLYPSGPTQQWTAVRRDASGSIVLVNPAKQAWTSGDTAIARVDAATGLVTPVSPGTTTLTETDTESGKSGSAPITVAALGSLVVTVPVSFANAKLVVVTVGSVQRYATRSNNQTSVMVAFTGLASGSYTVSASAYANNTASGAPLATGSASASIPASGGNVPVSVPLASNVRFAAISPAFVRMGVSSNQSLTGLAYDLLGYLIEGTPFTWASSNPSCVAVDAFGQARGIALGSAIITLTETESGKTAQILAVVTDGSTGSLKAQFNPSDPIYVAGGSAGGLTLNDGHSYQFNTSAPTSPTLTDTTTNAVVATGQYVTQSFSSERKSTTYAVFDFAQDIHIGSGSVVSGVGANPLVLLTQGSALIDGSATLSVSAEGNVPGAGGGMPGSGPGSGTFGSNSSVSSTTAPVTYFGGGSFGGGGGANYSAAYPYQQEARPTYGSDFATDPTPHLQGGSGGYNSFPNTNRTGGAGGGALYLAAQGTITVRSANITARGGDNATGGSGGGIVLLGRNAVVFTQATLNANGGRASGGQTDSGYYGGGGGGRIVIGYGPGANPPSLSLTTVLGGQNVPINQNYWGDLGTVVSTPFSGF